MISISSSELTVSVLNRDGSGRRHRYGTSLIARPFVPDHHHRQPSSSSPPSWHIFALSGLGYRIEVHAAPSLLSKIPFSDAKILLFIVCSSHHGATVNTSEGLAKLRDLMGKKENDVNAYVVLSEDQRE